MEAEEVDYVAGRWSSVSVARYLITAAILHEVSVCTARIYLVEVLLQRQTDFTTHVKFEASEF